MQKTLIKTLAASMALIGLGQPAHAVLDLVGPVDATNGFPSWYMDRNGVALELCVPNNAAELAGGACVILPADQPNLPEVFPSNWFLEHFYTLASVVLPTAGLGPTGTPVAGAGKLTINMGLEASFPSTPITNGQQITFNRWRAIQANMPCTGSYTYYTPNNAPQTFSATAGGKVFETSDIGVGSFTGPLAGTTGPFLVWSATPGGVAKAPFTANGKRYISDYTVAGGTAVTGSILRNPLLNSTKTYIPAAIKTMPFANYVLVEGPGVATGNCAATEQVSTTTGFQLFGRYFDGPIASPNRVDRATFVAHDTNNDGTPDTFYIGAWATAQQQPGGALPAMSMSLVAGDPANPTTVTPVATAVGRFAIAGTTPAKFQYFGTTSVARQSATQVRPGIDHVRLTITTDTPPTVLTMPLVDELNINEAMWDSTLKTLTVVAESGAYLAAASPLNQTAAGAACSAPCLTIDAQGLPKVDAAGVAIDYKMKSVPGSKFAIMQAVIPNVQVPPDTITVTSSAGGRDTKPLMYAGEPTGSAMLLPDTASTPMNVAVTIPVLANDVGVLAAPALQVCTAATGGTCAAPPAVGATLAACTLATGSTTVYVASSSCTTTGGRIQLTADNRLQYTPKTGVGGVTDSFWYQASTATGALRTSVTVSLGSASGLPDARDDLGLGGVVNVNSTYDILANDFAPAGINVASVRLQGDVCLSTPNSFACSPVTPDVASIDAQGRLVVRPTSVGTWTFHYTFEDQAGQTADPGAVTVNAVAGETLLLGKGLYNISKKAGITGTVVADGTTSIAQTHLLELRLPNSATGPQGCNNPTAGSKVAVTTAAAGAWAFGATAVDPQPATAYVYSPAYGACLQFTLTAK